MKRDGGYNYLSGPDGVVVSRHHSQPIRVGGSAAHNVIIGGSLMGVAEKPAHPRWARRLGVTLTRLGTWLNT